MVALSFIALVAIIYATIQFFWYLTDKYQKEVEREKQEFAAWKSNFWKGVAASTARQAATMGQCLDAIDPKQEGYTVAFRK